MDKMLLFKCGPYLGIDNGVRVEATAALPLYEVYTMDKNTLGKGAVPVIEAGQLSLSNT